MQVFTKEECMQSKLALFRDIRQGALFLYPTDTIYGIGCDATNEEAVQTLRSLKKQTSRPLSVIAPDKEWIKNNCEVSDEWMGKLPGPYTLIAPLIKKGSVASATIVGGASLGVRIPQHWFSELVAEYGFPIITTSANFSGQPFMRGIEDLDPVLENELDFAVYEGPLQARPSTLIDLTKGDPDVRER